jgi:hypothetical protein
MTFGGGVGKRGTEGRYAIVGYLRIETVHAQEKAEAIRAIAVVIDNQQAKWLRSHFHDPPFRVPKLLYSAATARTASPSRNRGQRTAAA